MSKLSLLKPQGTVLQIGEKDYELVYDFNAFAMLEDKFGSVQKAFDALTGTPKFVDVLAILQAGFASSKDKMTDKELGSYLTPRNIPDVISLVNEALTKVMPEVKETKSSKN